jgi:hypothetical protein
LWLLRLGALEGIWRIEGIIRRQERGAGLSDEIDSQQRMALRVKALLGSSDTSDTVDAGVGKNYQLGIEHRQLEPIDAGILGGAWSCLGLSQRSERSAVSEQEEPKRIPPLEPALESVNPASNTAIRYTAVSAKRHRRVERKMLIRRKRRYWSRPMS